MVNCAFDARIYKMSLEALVMPENKGVLKQNKGEIY